LHGHAHAYARRAWCHLHELLAKITAWAHPLSNTLNGAPLSHVPPPTLTVNSVATFPSVTCTLSAAGVAAATPQKSRSADNIMTLRGMLKCLSRALVGAREGCIWGGGCQDSVHVSETDVKRCRRASGQCQCHAVPDHARSTNFAFHHLKGDMTRVTFAHPSVGAPTAQTSAVLGVQRVREQSTRQHRSALPRPTA
jgi:hypothetical protein